MHSFSLHHDHSSYFIAYSCFIVVCAALATCLRPIAPKVPYSALILGIISAVHALAFKADIHNVSPKYFALGIVVLGLMAPLQLLILAKGTSQSFQEKWRAGNSFKEVLAVTFAWLLGLLIIAVPLALAYIPNAMVTGHFICNDSVIHALMSRGLAFMQTRGMDPIYLALPRGVHSFTYYFNSLLFQKEVSRIILPTSLTSFSLIVFWADMVVRLLGVRRRYWLPLTLLPATPFLLVTTAYMVFLGQIAGMALTLAAVTALCFFRRLGTLMASLAITLFLALGAITAYGLFPLSLIGFGCAMCLAVAFLKEPSISHWVAVLRELLSSVFTIRGGIIVGSFLVLLWPSIQFALYVVKVQGSGSTASDLISAVGNLPEGYLSPLHISGFWPRGAEYRQLLSKNFSPMTCLMLALLLGQTACIVGARFEYRIFLALATFFVPWLSSAILINSPYVNFKYLTYLVPVFVLAAGIGFTRCAERAGAMYPRLNSLVILPAVTLFLLVYLATAISLPLAVASVTPSLVEGEVLSLEAVAQEISAKRALILSREDWLQYYIQPDDILPLTLYIPNTYHGQPIDLVVVDRGYKQDATEFLKSFPQIAELISKGACLKVIGDRFESYPLECNQQPK